MRRFFLTGIAFFGLVLAGCSGDDSTGSASPPSNAAAPVAPAVTAQIAPAEIKGSRGTVDCVAFSPDGATFVVAGEGPEIKLYDTPTGKLRSQLEGMRSYTTAMTYSVDGKLIAAGGIEGTVKIWDTGAGKEVGSFKTDGKVQAVAFIDNGSTLVVAGWENSRMVAHGWDVRSGNEVFQTKYKGHPWPDATTEGYSTETQCMTISPDGKRLASASEGTKDLNVRVWDLRGGQQMLQLGITDPLHTLKYSPDSSILAGGDELAKLKFWDPSGRNLGVMQNGDMGISAIAFSRDGKLAATTQQRFVYLWDVASRTVIGNVEINLGITRCVDFSPDTKFAGFGEDVNAYIRALPAISLAKSQPAANPAVQPGGTFTLAGHERPIDAIVFSPDGKLLATAGEERSIKLWDIASRRCTLTMEGSRGMPVDLAFSPDCKRLASAGADISGSVAGGVEPPAAIRLWDLSNGSVLGYVETQGNTRVAVCFSADGKSFYAADKDGVVRRYDSDTFKSIGNFAVNLNGGKIMSLALSSDGKKLAIGATDGGHAGRLFVVDSPSGKDLFHADVEMAAHCVAFSRDGKWLVVVTGMADVYYTSRWKRVAKLEHRYYLGGAAFSPDNKYIATAGGGAAIKRWDVSTWKPHDQFPQAAQEDFNCIAYSPDGKLIAAAGGEQIVVWSPK